MDIFNTIDRLKVFLGEKRASGTISFVPTMGALHAGHISLVKKAAELSSNVVVSIFVNPIQFNNKEDFEKYPQLLENDLNLLSQSGCTAVFVPSVEEMYPVPVSEKYHFGALESVMEGACRPGHFNGVAVVVSRLFDIVQPDYACFGKKDYQQLAIIKELVHQKKYPVKIVPVEIMRECDGLAMSSRNLRLTAAEREVAPEIYRALKQAKFFKESMDPKDTENAILDIIRQNPLFDPEYITIADAETLQPINDWSDGKPVIFAAVFLGHVRLIDNLELFS